MLEELFELVDEQGRKVGLATRRQCHGNPKLIHQSVHVHVFDPAGRLFLQKRSAAKDVQPGKWDTAVGGHMQPGETPEQAARREMEEELGIRPDRLDPLYEYFWHSPIETELVRVYRTISAGPFRLNADEIESGRFWELSEIEPALEAEILTPNFAFEFRSYLRTFIHHC